METMLENEYHLHPSNSEFEGLPEGYEATKEGNTAARLYSMDCEMVKTEKGSEIARVTVINSDSTVLLDDLCKPESPVLDYLTQWSGITEAKLQNIETRFGDVRKKFLDLIHAEDTLVGHSLDSDLNALKIVHPRIIDTSCCYSHTRGGKAKPSLKWLAEKWLKRSIQTSQSGHDSVEDAKTALDLVYLKLKNGLDFGLYKQNMESIFQRLDRQDAPIKSAIVERGSKRKWQSPETKYACEDNDDDTTQNILKAFEDGMQFVWARYYDLSFVSGWTQRRPAPTDKQSQNGDAEKASETSHQVNSEQQRQPEAQKDSDSAPAESDLREAYEALNKRLQEVWDNLPSGTAVIMYSGTGDVREMSRLNRRQRAHRAEFKHKKWDELENKWDDNDAQALRAAVDSARTGVSFVGLKV